MQCQTLATSSIAQVLLREHSLSPQRKQRRWLLSTGFGMACMFTSAKTSLSMVISWETFVCSGSCKATTGDTTIPPVDQGLSARDRVCKAVQRSGRGQETCYCFSKQIKLKEVRAIGRFWVFDGNGLLGHQLVDSRWFEKNPPTESGWKRRSKNRRSTSISRGNDRDNREVLQTEPVRFSERSASGFWGGHGQSTHEHVRTESLFCKQKIDFRFHFRFGQFRWRSDWGLSRRFWRKPCCSRVTKWQSGLGEEERLFLPWLALQGSAGRDW